MSNPKILHLVLDGYSPDNHYNFFDNFEDVVPTHYFREKFVRDVDISEGKLRSPNQWTKIYSKTSFEEIHEEGDSARLGVSTKISRIPRENFIWNKLAAKKVNSWIYPYGHYYKVIDRNLLVPSTKEYVSGFLKMYGTKLGCMIDNGEKSWHKSPISVYYGTHESSWNRESKQTKVFDDYRTKWKAPDEAFISRVPDEVHKYYLEKMSYYFEMDSILFSEEILPHLDFHINKNIHAGGYVHIGLIEPDTPYHFTPEYPDIVKIVREYCNRIIYEAINMLAPDIIIITGDHNMAPVTKEDFSNAILLDYSKHSGNKAYGAQSSWGITPILTEHGHSVGAMLYAKDRSILDDFRDNYYEKDKYLMYDIYNFLEDIYE